MAGPNSQNQYTPQSIQLDGGLDFITPKVMVPGGTLSGCLNFERTDRYGYSRIAGYEFYDGGSNASLAYTNAAYIVHDANVDVHGIREALVIDGRTKVMGTILKRDGATKTVLAITNFDEWRLVLAAVNAGNTITLTPAGGGSSFVVSDVKTYYEGSTDLADSKAETLDRNELFISIRDIVAYPGAPANPVIGLRGYKNHLYAIKDLATVYFNSGGTTQIYPNATLKQTSGGSDEIYVADISLLSGSWAGGDATGVIQTTRGEIPATGTYDLLDEDGAVATANVLTVATAPVDVDMSTDNAGLWVDMSFNEAPYQGGWESIPLGFSVDFEDGTIYGPFHIARRGTFSDYTSDITQAPGHGTTGTTTDGAGTGGHIVSVWNIVPVGDVPASVNNDTGTTNRALCTMGGSLGMSNIPHIDLGAVNIPDFAGDSSMSVKGLEIQIRNKQTATPGFAGYVTMDAEIQTSGTTITDSDVKTLEVTQSIVDNTLVYGGPTDLWGLADEAALKAVLDPATFGVKLSPSMFPGADPQTYGNSLYLYDVKVVVYYTQTISQYYFYDGVDDVTADVTYQYVTSTDDGSWEEGASGTLQVTNIHPSGSATRNYIKDGDEIWTGPLRTGLQIATVSSEMAYNGLDTLAEIEAANSRYQMIVSNFYADEDFEAIYGVSGAGRAFSYDGFYFTRIFTQADATKDKPRHVANHQFHLALGYRSGAVLLSAAGNPLDFLGVDGAVEVDTGDPVQGFAKMPGTTLGIFCKDSIQGLVGSSPDNFTLSVMGPYEGALEYSVADIGRTIYTSNKGISMFDQTAAYGDFVGQRLSYAVTPWLLPRLQGTVSPLGVNAASAGPVTAIVDRSHNQYILIFGDGAQLTMTLTGPDMQPQFTIQAKGLYDSEGTYLGNFVPRAESSFIDDTGAERLHLSHYSESVPLDTYYVYEHGKSWTFNGEGIPAYIITNENFFGSPFNYDVDRKGRLHGLSLGYAPLTCRAETDYDSNQDITYSPREAVNASLPREPTASLFTDLMPVTCMSNLSSRGRSFSMRFASYNTTTQPAGIDPVYADVCPPFVLQALLPQYTENKGDT